MERILSPEATVNPKKLPRNSVPFPLEERIADLERQLNKARQQLEEVQARCRITQSLWDYERSQILGALGVSVAKAPGDWRIKDLVNEVKDCLEGGRLIEAVPPANGEAASGPPREAVLSLVKLGAHDRELKRAWKHFPDPVSAHHGYCWEYLATELIGAQWVHVFYHELHPERHTAAYARVPASPGWGPKP
jgi:hypothetical protein